MKWNLIYIDDQIENIEVYKELLSDKFYVIGTNDAMAYGNILQSNHPHAILLDVHMPKIDGFELHKKIINHPLYNGCPILFISGDHSDDNRIKSYVEGGVDFLPRDISGDEIILRLTNKVKFFLQRSNTLKLGNLSIDVQAMKATLDNMNIDLTLLEFRILTHMVRLHPNTLNRSELILKVWGNDSVKPGTLSTHLTNLKPKIESWAYQIKVRDENVLIQKKQ